LNLGKAWAQIDCLLLETHPSGFMHAIVVQIAKVVFQPALVLRTSLHSEYSLLGQLAQSVNQKLCFIITKPKNWKLVIAFSDFLSSKVVQNAKKRDTVGVKEDPNQASDFVDILDHSSQLSSQVNVVVPKNLFHIALKCVKQCLLNLNHLF
jgi:hypothetical protein